MPRKSNWTGERTELLKKLWSDGVTADNIATQLGGVTRNGVIGKIHRLQGKDKQQLPRSKVKALKRIRAPVVYATASRGTLGRPNLTHRSGVASTRAGRKPRKVLSQMVGPPQQRKARPLSRSEGGFLAFPEPSAEISRAEINALMTLYHA